MLRDLRNNQYKGHVGASPVEGRRLGWFQDAEVTFSGVGMGSSLARMICSPAYAWLCALLVALGADGCTVSTLELEHSLRSDGDVAVAVALNGRDSELRQGPPRQGCRLERGSHDAQRQKVKPIDVDVQRVGVNAVFGYVTE